MANAAASPDPTSLFWRARRLQALVFQVGGRVEGRVLGGRGCTGKWAGGRAAGLHAVALEQALTSASLPDRPPQDWPRLGPAAQRAIEGWEAEVEAERRPAMEAEYIEKVGGRQMRLAAAWLLCGPAGAF